MNRPLPYIAALVSWLSLTAVAPAADRSPFVLKDGDRIVLLGDDLIERNLKHGYLETLLTLANPGKHLIFRNLGWSGDTVFGDARAGFGSRPDGFKQLKEHVQALRPTVILVGYGMSDSFEGKAGLDSFQKGLNVLLDVLDETKATIVLISPIRHEDLGRPLPDPSAHNRSLQLYRDVLASTAGNRGLKYIDLASVDSGNQPSANGEPKPDSKLTDDGIHLTQYGYWLIDSKIASELSENLAKRWSVRIRPDGTAAAKQAKVSDYQSWSIRIQSDGTAAATPAKVANLQRTPQLIKFEVLDETLPLPPRPGASGQSVGSSGEARVLGFDGLEPGRYTLTIDGKRVATGSAEQWKSMTLSEGPEFKQVEQLREVVNKKNLLYFYRWRPQNETYLFGFRKHEQGNNAREIPLFDPLVEAQEKEIAKLRVPVSHAYELSRESGVGR